MFFAPISKAVTQRISISKRQKPQPRVPIAAPAALFLFLFLIPLSAHTQTQPQSPQFEDLASRAAAARDQGNLPQAIDLYSQAAQLKPDWAEGWFYLGMLQYAANSYSPAIDAFNHLLQLKPGAPPALALRGLCEFETADYDNSLRDLAEAVAKGAAHDPRNEQIIRYHLAQLLARAGSFQDAVTQYQFFATHSIDDPELLLGLGLAGMRNTTLPKDVPTQGQPLYRIVGHAGFVFLAGYSQEADVLFNQLFARYPTTPNLHFFYGTLIFPHDPELAVPQFQAEVALAPSNPQAHAILAFTLMLVGRYAEAIPEARTALAAIPEMEMAQLALGRSLAETGDEKQATEILNHVLSLDPDSIEAHRGLSIVYSRTGRKEDAYRERMACLHLEK
ncbi:MAG: tetratricopeptide repeat protein [Terracidiphilus sp.]|jgi:tetratricopeptide (TPR) repeat protein